MHAAPVRVADRKLKGVTCIRLDTTVVPAHSDNKGAEPNFRASATTRCSRAAITPGSRWPGCSAPGSAGSNTAADHLRILREAIGALPPAFRRQLMVTCDWAGASHDLVKELDRLASRRGYEVT